MEAHKYKVELIGVGRLHSPIIELENIPITMNSNNLKTWECSEIEVPVEEKLNIKALVHAITGTSWKLVITNKKNNKKVLEKEETTGSKPNKPNKSEEFYEVDPS